MILLEAVTADGAGTPLVAKGGTRSIFAYGTFGGGTCTLEMSPDDGTTWINHPDLTFTTDAVVNFLIASGISIRGNLVGSSGANLNLEMR